MASNAITQAFQSDWTRLHFGRQPIGPLLREDGSLPWVRFHSLPNSKRYAENELERQTILNRANQLGEALLSQVECWLVSTDPSDCELPWAFGGQIEYDVGTDDEFIVPYFVRETAWKAGAFDQLFAAIAEDDARYVWVSRRNGSVLAPYDGGFDLFSASSEELAAVAARWSGWLSKHPGGL